MPSLMQTFHDNDNWQEIETKPSRPLNKKLYTDLNIFSDMQHPFIIALDPKRSNFPN